MKLNKDLGIFDADLPSTNENYTPEVGGSQIVEPNIIVPIYSLDNVNSPVTNLGSGAGANSSTIPTQVLSIIDSLSDTPTNSTTAGASTNPATVVTPTNSTTNTNTPSEPSATTDDNKTYVGGGTTPDSNIVIKKSKTKYFIYGGIALVGIFFLSRLFSKKS